MLFVLIHTAHPKNLEKAAKELKPIEVKKTKKVVYY